ncbi:hypothetical protein H2203_003924 [Taxawa tesnikishii (nom. ined.)]|nr:hypothetical protein H2203_003924 [Dothideales sp. JES 119]
MKTSVLSAALLAGSATAAPTLLSSILGAITNDLNTLLSSLGITLSTNGGSHVPLWVPKVALSAIRYSHFISWPKGVNGGNFINWSTYKANGVNLGGWLEKEYTHDPIWWDTVAPGTPDEWTLCEKLGTQCGPVLEARYASFLNTSTIDQLASVGVNTLRIPTTYAAWVSVPGSALYHGNQQTYLKTIAQYAISKYNMHVIIGLHSLPGGVNSLDIGEAFGHDNWFQNSTNLDYSFQAIDGILNFIKASGHINAFTISPINEPSDNLPGFATPAGLTANGTNWINTYINGCLKKIAKVDKRIPLMLQDAFLGEKYWSPFYASSTNIVIDTHVYYFAASGIYSQYVAPAICGQASTLAGDKKFPVFVGEWALQTLYNNTFAGRKEIFDTQRYAWQNYVSGGSFWTAQSYSVATVDGQGEQRDYWSYGDLINAGVITSATNASYC